MEAKNLDTASITIFKKSMKTKLIRVPALLDESVIKKLIADS